MAGVRILKYFTQFSEYTKRRESITPCPYKAGVIILSPECKACEYYAGECITHSMRCRYEDLQENREILPVAHQ